ASGREPPAMQIIVGIDRRNVYSRAQLLGVAKRDLYLLVDDRSFQLNFLKGAVGLWFSACLVLGLAGACSTYLSRVITLLTTVFLCVAGLFRDYITKVALGQSEGGGPMESVLRLWRRQGLAGKLDESLPEVSFAQGFDEVYRWWLRLVLNIFPDISRFNLTEYVAKGFDISWVGVLLLDNLVPLLAYLLPWGVLAYYLMKSREIANPT